MDPVSAPTPYSTHDDLPGLPVEIVIPNDLIRRDEGLGWVVGLGDAFPSGDSETDQRRSTVELLEDGRPLGPSHALHSRIRAHGRGLYSHWDRWLYFSTADNSDPRRNGRRYSLRGKPGMRPEAGALFAASPAGREEAESPLFPRLARLAPHLSAEAEDAAGPDAPFDPAGGDAGRRIRLLEAKVEYLLDELYAAKSQLRLLTPQSPEIDAVRRHQIASFDYQWKHLPYHDAFLSNPAWAETAAAEVEQRSGLPRGWFAGKRILDCGCGPGRFTWTFASLGAEVVAFDTSDAGLQAARQACRGMGGVTIERRNILDPLPYGGGFDLVWSYGVVHITGDTLGALRNIAGQARPGGLLYFMVYGEPQRGSIDEFAYHHEVHTIRQALSGQSFERKAEILRSLQGERWAQCWFDAISSEINDLYTEEELRRLLSHLGFTAIRRTMPQENSLNMVAVRPADG